MNFFEYYPTIVDGLSIRPFTPIYFLLLVITFFCMALVLWIGYNQSYLNRRKTMTCLVWSLPILELIRQVWLVWVGGYDVTDHLPIHLCGLMVFLIPLWWMTKNPFLENFTYYAGVFGALMALLFNNNHAPWFNLQTFQTFIVHGVILLIPIFNLMYLDFRPEKRYFRSCVLFLAALGGIVYIVNLNLGSNYFFLMQATERSPLILIDAIVGYPWGILVASAGIVFIWYLMFIFFERALKRKTRYQVSEAYINRHHRVIR